MNIGHFALIAQLLMFTSSAVAQNERELIDKYCTVTSDIQRKLAKVKSCQDLIDSGKVSMAWKGVAYSEIGTAYYAEAVSDALSGRTKVNSRAIDIAIQNLEIAVKLHPAATFILANVYEAGGIYSDADFNVRVGYIRKSLYAWTSAIKPVAPGFPESRMAYSGRGNLKAKICDPIGAEADLRSAINIAKKLNTNGALDAEINGYLTSITAIDSECRPEMKDVNWK